MEFPRQANNALFLHVLRSRYVWNSYATPFRNGIGHTNRCCLHSLLTHMLEMPMQLDLGWSGIEHPPHVISIMSLAADTLRMHMQSQSDGLA